MKDLIDNKELKSLAMEADNCPLKLDDKWYLINITWYQKWSAYIGLNNDDKMSHHPPPGCINNRILLDADGQLKEDLIEQNDFKLIPEKLWTILRQTYGVDSEKDTMERKVINDSLSPITNPKYTVELRYLKVEVTCHNWKSQAPCVFYFSRQTPLKTVVDQIRAKFEVPSNKPVRLYIRSPDQISNPIENYESGTLSSAGFSSSDTLTLSVQGDDGNWIAIRDHIITIPNSNIHRVTSDSLTKNIPSPPSLHNSNEFTRTPMVTRSSKNNYENSYSSRHSEARAGLCGLYNLGNTCFMNSAIQCMSNVPLLTDYFRSGKYLKEINKENPLGRKGELAYAYADLVNEMWSGTNSFSTPRQFKMHISKFAPQFTGFQQQDSQELLAYMLDGLHEDLNRILKKPYIESNDEKNIPDEELAKETWENYLKRNDSIIVDIFHGLIKSTLNCLICDKISIKFDPICYLSLPLPSKKERLIEFKLVPYKQTDPLVKYKLTVLKNASIKDLLKVLEDYSKIPRQRLIALDVYSNKFFHAYEPHEPVTNIREKDEIYIYELPVDVNNNEYLKFQFYLKNRTTHHYSNSYFGLPLFFCVPKADLKVDTMYDYVTTNLKRFLNDTDTSNIPDSGSDEINKKLSNSLGFNDDRHQTQDDSDEEIDLNTSKKTKSITQRLFKLFLGKADHYDYDNQNQAIDEKTISLIANSNATFLTLVAEFSTPVKEHLYNTKVYEDVIEHESCNAKLVNRRDLLKLDDCFNLFTKKEELSDSDLWYCPKCKKHQHATKQIDLWQLPPVLVIHLKRFSYSRVFRDKIDTLVEFPIRDLDLTAYIKNSNNRNINKYNLIAVSNHYGGLGGGHYTAYAQNRDDGRWYHFDDSSVNAIDETSVCTPAAYLLVYLRQDYHSKNVKNSETNEYFTTTKNVSTRQSASK